MACGAGSPPLHSFANDLSEDHPAFQSLRRFFEVVSLTCSNIQILQLANKFRLLSDDQILRWAEDCRPQCESIRFSRPKQSEASSLGDLPSCLGQCVTAQGIAENDSTSTGARHAAYIYLYKTDFYNPSAFSESSSNRNSLFSIVSGSSQATTLSNRSQSRFAPTENLHAGISQQPQDLLQRQVTPIHDLAEPVNQSSPISINKNSLPVHICVACNIPFKAKSSLSRHQKQHCERNIEWVCWLCVPTKNFYRKEKLCQHHIEHHGVACVPGCKQQWGGLCGKHLDRSLSEFPPKKAWGCPCCLRAFDSFEAWTRHGGTHSVQNDKVVGWSLSTMVRSLIRQRYLKDAIVHLPWAACDPGSVKADVCQNLREALERHKLPDAVQDHYDYRYLQLPEALALYAFRLVAYGGPYLEDSSHIRSETKATTTSEQARTGLPGQHFSPSLQRVPSIVAPGYWNPEEPFTYKQRPQIIGQHGFVDGNSHEHLLNYSESDLPEPKQLGAGIQSPQGENFAQPYGHSARNRLCTPSSEPSLSLQSSGIRASQELNCAEKRGRGMNMKKSLQNLVHRPSTAKSATSYSESIPPVPVPMNDRSLEITKTAAIIDHNKDSTRYDPMDVLTISPRQARLSARMSDVQMDLYVTWPPEEPLDP